VTSTDLLPESCLHHPSLSAPGPLSHLIGKQCQFTIQLTLHTCPILALSFTAYEQAVQAKSIKQNLNKKHTVLSASSPKSRNVEIQNRNYLVKFRFESYEIVGSLRMRIRKNNMTESLVTIKNF